MEGDIIGARSSKEIAKRNHVCFNAAMNPVTRGWNHLRAMAVGAACILALLAPQAFGAPAPIISLIINPEAAKPVQHGCAILKACLEGKGAHVETGVNFEDAPGETIIVAGLASGGSESSRLMRELQLT